MTILLSTGDFYPNVGGVAAVVRELSQALVRRGNNVHVAHWSDSSGSHPTMETLNGVQIHRLVIPTYPFPLNRALWLTRPRQVLAPLVDRIRPDVFHCHTLFPDGYVARTLSRSCVTVFTNHTSQFLHDLKDWRKRKEWSWVLRGYDLVLAPSQELVDGAKELGARQTQYISNGVDARRFVPADAETKAKARARLDLPEDALIILAARRIERKNGLRYLAEAFVKMRDEITDALLLSCGPAGDVQELAAMKAIFAAAGGEYRVEFRGSVLNDCMPLYYQAADISVLPSLMEATSVSGLESMSCGLPLVGTDVGGIPQIIESGKTGLVVPARDPDAFCNALLAMSQDRAMRERMGRFAREAVETQFDWDAVAQQTEAAYQAMLSARGRASTARVH